MIPGRSCATGVIDAYIRVSVIGIEILTIDARIVIASVDTYLHFAEAVNRLDLTATEKPGIEALSEFGSAAKDKATGASKGAKDKIVEPAKEKPGKAFDRAKEKISRD